MSADGRRLRSEHLWCTFLADSAAQPPRVGFAIGRTVGPAVARNRLRRRLRAIIAASAGSADVPPGWLLVGPRRNIDELSYDQLVTEWATLARQLRRTGDGEPTDS
ncbi:MAG: ribonuclease P protein component [Acidimicrobiia bacterium]|nr:ribonuclease P protein component [Acidimicrobiia bacterium]